MIDFFLNKKDNLIYILGGAVVPIFFVAHCFSTISYKGAVFMCLSAVLSSAAAVLYGFVWKYIWDSSLSSRKICAGTNALAFIVLILMLLTVQTEFGKGQHIYAYFGIIVCALVCIINFVWVIKDNYLSAKKILAYCAEHKYIAAVLVFCAALAAEGIGYPLKWDGLLYYDAVNKASLGSLSSIALYGHVSVTAGFVYRLLFALFGMGKLGMIIANLLMLMVAIIAFYGIIKTVCPGKKEWQYALSCLPFGVSPFLAGMAGYYSTDWFSVCLITVLIYFMLKKQWILSSVSAILFCLTKEPALIAYTGLCIGLVLNDFFSRTDKVWNRLKALLGTIHYYMLLIPYFIWFVIYKIMGHWSAGNGGFGVDVEFVIEKSKVLFGLNFNWIWVAIIIASTVAMVIGHKLKENAEWLWMLFGSNLCLFLFNIIFKTVNHPRYIDSFISVTLLLGILCLWKVPFSEKILASVLVVLTALGIVSCYRSIDPISNILFESNNVGSAKLISTGESPMGDEAIYNKQMMWVEKPLCEAISEAIEENTEIAIVINDDAVYAYNGMSQYIYSDSTKDIMFWDDRADKRVSYADADYANARKIDINYCPKDGKLKMDSGVDRDISIIYISGINDYALQEGYVLKATKDYKYRGFVIRRDILAKVK